MINQDAWCSRRQASFIAHARNVYRGLNFVSLNRIFEKI